MLKTISALSPLLAGLALALCSPRLLGAWALPALVCLSLIGICLLWPPRR